MILSFERNTFSTKCAKMPAVSRIMVTAGGFLRWVAVREKAYFTSHTAWVVKHPNKKILEVVHYGLSKMRKPSSRGGGGL